MIRTPKKNLVFAWLALALSLFLAAVLVTRAADHGDAPATAHDLGADLNDCYLFLDPNNNSRVVIIMTIHGFIPPGENGNFGVFDPALRYRFELEQGGDAIPDSFIDVFFSRRVAANGVPQPQMATVRFTGFNGNTAYASVPTTNPSATSPTAVPQVIANLSAGAPYTTPPGASDIAFFAGLTDDPFFFDIPAFGRFVASVRAGAPNPAVFNRGRDSFAGYNTLAIAFSFPASLIRGNSSQLGLSTATQRRSPEYFNTRTGQVGGFGRWVNIDRTGVPAVNVALVPFNSKDEFNSANTLDDANLRFAGGIISTLQLFGTDQTSINILAQVAVLRGDILRMDYSIANTGDGGGNNVGAGFPNARRLRDDVIDTEFFLINNRNPLPDNANANDVTFTNAFPFLAPAQQPRDPGNLDDNTRN